MNEVSNGLAWRRSARRLAFGNVVIAIAWACVGWWMFEKVGTLTLIWQVNEMLRMNERLTNTAASPSPRGGALSVLTFSAQRPAGRVTAADAKRAELEMGRIVVWVEGTRQVWSLLTAACVGVLAAGGVGLWLAGSRGGGVGAMRLLMAMMLVCATYAMGFMIGQFHHGNWEVTIPRLSQQRAGWYLPVLVIAAAAGLAGTLGISRGRNPRTWMGVSIAAGLIGTFATLVGISLLIHAGLPPLPPWVYAVVALAQSCWSWVLLFTLLGMPRGEDAESRLRVDAGS